jgi:uncharacterized membrane protein YfcA
MGILILVKVFRRKKKESENISATPLALAGGFCDAVGGGGWGPIVTSTLLAGGKSARHAIGTVNLTEFFVTLAEAATFFTLIGLGNWRIVLGLIIGGTIAAPFAALICKRLPEKGLLAAVGVVITVLSIRTIAGTFGLPFLF